MKQIFLLSFFLISLLNANFLDITLKKDSKYAFEEYQLMNIGDGTTHLKKEVPREALELHGNFNDTFGIKIEKTKEESDYTLNENELYLGSSHTTYFSYAQKKQEVQYSNTSQIHSTNKTTKFSIYDFLTIEKGDNTMITNSNVSFRLELNTGDVKENNKSISAPLTYTSDLEVITLTTENLYKDIQADALSGEDFITPVGFAKNFNPFFRIYGVFILSYEHHSKSSGRIRFENNSTMYTIGAEQDSDTGAITYKAFDNDVKISDDSSNTFVGENARHKGFGYGYKITLEASIEDISLFLTAYEKKTKLKAYHTDNITNTQSIAIVQNNTLNYHTKNITFGIKYRF